MIGRMRDRVVLQRATESGDSFGFPARTWTNLATVWGEVDWQGGQESSQGDREFSEVPVTVTVRRSSDTMSVREKDRVLVPLATTTLRSTINASTTAMVLSTPDVMPPEGDFTARLATELVTVTAGAGSTASPYTVTRGAYSTTAASHQSGVAVIHMVPVDVVGVAPDARRRKLVLTCVRDEVQNNE